MERKLRAATIHGPGQGVVFPKADKVKGKIIGLQFSEQYAIIVVELDSKRRGENAIQHTNRKSGRKV